MAYDDPEGQAMSELEFEATQELGVDAADYAADVDSAFEQGLEEQWRPTQDDWQAIVNFVQRRIDEELADHPAFQPDPETGLTEMQSMATAELVFNEMVSDVPEDERRFVFDRAEAIFAELAARYGATEEVAQAAVLAAKGEVTSEHADYRMLGELIREAATMQSVEVDPVRALADAKATFEMVKKQAPGLDEGVALARAIDLAVGLQSPYAQNETDLAKHFGRATAIARRFKPPADPGTSHDYRKGGSAWAVASGLIPSNRGARS